MDVPTAGNADPIASACESGSLITDTPFGKATGGLTKATSGVRAAPVTGIVTATGTHGRQMRR